MRLSPVFSFEFCCAFSELYICHDRMMVGDIDPVDGRLDHGVCLVGKRLRVGEDVVYLAEMLGVPESEEGHGDGLGRLSHLPDAVGQRLEVGDDIALGAGIEVTREDEPVAEFR